MDGFSLLLGFLAGALAVILPLALTGRSRSRDQRRKMTQLIADRDTASWMLRDAVDDALLDKTRADEDTRKWVSLLRAERDRLCAKAVKEWSSNP